MTNWLVDQLRQLADWIEARRKPAPDFSSFVTKEQFNAQATEWAKALADLGAKVEKQKSEIQNISLLVGFNRPIQTAGRKA